MVKIDSKDGEDYIIKVRIIIEVSQVFEDSNIDITHTLNKKIFKGIILLVSNVFYIKGLTKRIIEEEVEVIN